MILSIYVLYYYYYYFIFLFFRAIPAAYGSMKVPRLVVESEL